MSRAAPAELGHVPVLLHEAMAALDRPNGTDHGPGALDGSGEPAAVSAPF